MTATIYLCLNETQEIPSEHKTPPQPRSLGQHVIILSLVQSTAKQIHVLKRPSLPNIDTC
jgi:hypothetical protein